MRILKDEMSLIFLRFSYILLAFYLPVLIFVSFGILSIFSDVLDFIHLDDDEVVEKNENTKKHYKDWIKD